MAKYKEVHDKQAALEAMAERDEKMNKGLFVGCECSLSSPPRCIANNNSYLPSQEDNRRQWQSC